MFLICHGCYNDLRVNGLSLEELRGQPETPGRIARCETCGEYHEALNMHHCTGQCAPFPRYGRKVVGPSETKVRTG